MDKRLPIWAQFVLCWLPIVGKVIVEHLGCVVPAWLFLLSLVCAMWLCSLMFYYSFLHRE